MLIRGTYFLCGPWLGWRLAGAGLRGRGFCKRKDVGRGLALRLEGEAFTTQRAAAAL